jgi:hypothetical protein
MQNKGTPSDRPQSKSRSHFKTSRAEQPQPPGDANAPILKLARDIKTDQFLGRFGRVLPLLLKEFALYGGKPWKDGINVIGCSVQGFDGHGAASGVRVILLQADGLRVVPFCVGDEAASWAQSEWAYKGGLKDLVDDPSVSMVSPGCCATPALCLPLRRC